MTNKSELLERVAEIAGWTGVQEWQPDPKNPRPRKTYEGTNLAHPELGGFVPNYVEDLNAIANVFLLLKLQWDLVVAWDGRAYASSNKIGQPDNTQVADTPALALCKLLVAINPDPIKPKVECERCKAVPSDFQAESVEKNSGVIEVSFG